MSILLICLFVVLLGSMFVIVTSAKGEESIPKDTKGMADDAYYQTVCASKCVEKEQYELTECSYVPKDINGDEIGETCGEIFTRIGEEEAEIPEEKEKIGTYMLKKENFYPCSEGMTITFAEIFAEVPDLMIKVANKESGDVVPLSDMDGNLLTEGSGEDSGYYQLCNPCNVKNEDIGKIETKFKLPCTESSQLEKFIAGTYEISFRSGNLKGKGSNGEDVTLKLHDYTMEWSCENDAGFPQGIFFNQLIEDEEDMRETKVEFKKDMRPAPDEPMKAEIVLTNGCSSGSCKNSKSLEYHAAPNPEDSYYYFKIDPVEDTLEEVRFHLKVKDVHVCTPKVETTLSCSNSVSYLCYKDPDDNKEYILHGGPREQDSTAIYSLDGVCYYDRKEECTPENKKCIHIETKEAYLLSESQCKLPDYYYRNTCIKDKDRYECKYPDLSITDLRLCTKSDICSDTTKFTAAEATSDFKIMGTIRNIGNTAIKFHKDNLELRVEALPEQNRELYWVQEDGTKGAKITNAEYPVTIEEGKKIIFEYTPVNGLDNSGKLWAGTHTLTATISNIDTAYIPTIYEADREKSNVLERKITIYPAKCKDCSYASMDKCLGDCPGLCEWVWVEVTGGGTDKYECTPTK